MEKPDKDKFLEIFPFFRKGVPNLVRDLLACSHYSETGANTILQLEGQFCASLGLMVFGEKRIFKVSETGREITLYEVGKGEVCILNATCILSNTPCPVNAESLTKVGMLLLPANYFCNLIEQYQDLRVYIFSLISQNITSMMDLIMEVVFRRMDERLMDYLVEKSEEGKLFTSRQRIARDLGTAREVVSRLLKDFERKQLIILSKDCIELLGY